MFRINITETAGTISHADYISSKVALHFNVNYWPAAIFGGSCSEASLSAASAAHISSSAELT